MLDLEYCSNYFNIKFRNDLWSNVITLSEHDGKKPKIDTNIYCFFSWAKTSRQMCDGDARNSVFALSRLVQSHFYNYLKHLEKDFLLSFTIIIILFSVIKYVVSLLYHLFSYIIRRLLSLSELTPKTKTTKGYVPCNHSIASMGFGVNSLFLEGLC